MDCNLFLIYGNTNMSSRMPLMHMYACMYMYRRRQAGGGRQGDRGWDAI